MFDSISNHIPSSTNKNNKVHLADYDQQGKLKELKKAA
jgi:hypothetical protein